jgi:hypothetical protein
LRDASQWQPTYFAQHDSIYLFLDNPSLSLETAMADAAINAVYWHLADIALMPTDTRLRGRSWY